MFKLYIDFYQHLSKHHFRLIMLFKSIVNNFMKMLLSDWVGQCILVAMLDKLIAKLGSQ